MRTRSSATSTSGSDRPVRFADVLSTVPCGNGPSGPGLVKQSPGVAGPAARLRRPDQASSRRCRRPGLWRLRPTVPVPVDIADDQERAVARTRSDRRVHRRPRARIAHRAAHGGRGHDDRARGRAHADPVESEHPALLQPAASGGRPRDRASGTGRAVRGRRRRRRPRQRPGNPELLQESTTVAVCVIIAWLVGWSILGAWRMVTRDA